MGRLKTILFVLSGTIAALCGVILTARFASARADAGQGMTLTVVTIVLLGGVNIFGGSGSIPGVGETNMDTGLRVHRWVPQRG